MLLESAPMARLLSCLSCICDSEIVFSSSISGEIKPMNSLLSSNRVVRDRLLPSSDGKDPLKLLYPKSNTSSSFSFAISPGMFPQKELLRRIMDFTWVSFPSSGVSIPSRPRSFKFRTATCPSEHSTPNHEQGSTTPTSSFQFDKAP